MYNLLGYSQNCSLTLGKLWNYDRDEIDDVGNNAYQKQDLNDQPGPNQDGNQPPRPNQPPIPPL